MAEQVSSLKTGIKYKDTPIGKIPVDWELVRLGDICSISSGGASNYSKDVNEKTYPVYGSNGILGSYDEFNFSDGLVIGRVGASGSIHMISSPVWASDNTLLLSITDRFAQKLFIYYYLQKCNLPGLATKTAQPLLTQQILKSVLIAKPNIYEQKKIAEILTTVDEVIEKTDQIIEKTKEVKKGLMQELLTRGIGHKKFKKTEIGEIPEEWEVKKLVDTASGEKYSFTGGPFGSDLKQDSFTDYGVRVIQLQNIGDGDFLDDYKIFTSEEKADQLKNCNIYPGDIIIAKMAEPVARACIIPDMDDRYLMASDGIRLSVDRNKYDTKLILLAINSPYFRKNAEKHGTGTTRLRIGLTELKNLPIGIPPLEEQKQIAEILSSADEGIEKEMNHREQLEALKKGLMQVLLTGKIRVSV